MSAPLENNKDVCAALSSVVESRAVAKRDGDEDGDARRPAVVKGQVVRRRPRSRRLVFVDVALEQQHGGPFVIAVELAADTLLGGEDMTVQLRHSVRPGDVVIAEGNLLPPPSNSSSVYCAELKCMSLVVDKKWDPSNGSFVPHVLDQACDPSGDVEAGHSSGEDEEGGHEASNRDQDNDPNVSLCKAWINSGKCLKGAGCKFRHGTLGESIGKARAQWVQQRRKARLVLPSTAGDPVKGEEKEDYKERARIFCSWLEQTFGLATLQQGVIDVAGGRGDLSFELMLGRGVPSVVIDPRPIRFSKRQHREVENMLAANLLSDPEHVATMLKTCRSAGGKAACKCAQTLMQQRQAYFGPEFFNEETNPAGAQLVAGAGLVVGLHPDEATDAILLAALAHHKPFAIVPCCVFSLQNPHRKLQSGAAVSSYEDYIEWLAAHDPRIQRAFLPLAGKNQVLYCLAGVQGGPDQQQLQASDAGTGQPSGE